MNCNTTHYRANSSSVPGDPTAESLTETVAANAEVAIDLAPGVELDRVFDRSFRRSGNRITVPLGTFAKGEVKTILLRVRAPARSDGEQAVAGVELAYRDLIANTDASCTGKLGVEITGDSSEVSDLDPVVEGRVRRSETASVLKSANALFAQGRLEEARRKLDEQAQALRAAGTKAKTAAPELRAKAEADFESQVAAVDNANNDFQRSFATPPPAVAAEPATGSVAQAAPRPAAAPPPQQSREGKSAVKRNLEKADAFAF